MLDTSSTRRQVLVGASAAVAAAPILASAQALSVNSPDAEAKAAASRIGQQLFSARPAPALSFAVARRDGVVWAEALGKANIEQDVAATPAHTLPLGSVSKVLTTTAAAKLVSRGVLDLDAPISGYMPDLPEHHRTTTTRQLLTHRGGVRHYLPRDYDIFGPGGAVYMRLYRTNADVLALFIDDPLIAPPGGPSTYSSYGYTLASMVMEAAAGTPFRTLIADEIGVPFGLASLGAEDPWEIVPNRASRYMNAPDVNLLYGMVPEAARPKLTDGFANMPMTNSAYCWAGAGFTMTPSDTARFGAALLEGPESRISAAERRLLFTPLTQRTPQQPPLGLGWRVDQDAKGRPRWHHAGATPGGRFLLMIYPELGLSVAMAGNVMNLFVDVNKAASELADVFA